jgi:nucleoid-associated protein YgaU
MRKSKSTSALSNVFTTRINLQESYPSLILGAIIVVILGLLVANFLSRGTQQIDQGEQTTLTQEEAAAPQAGSQYIIRENDSLAKISEQVYGSQEMWPAIASVNNIADPDRILAGNTLELPAKEELATQETAMTLNTYQVQAGDTFFTIAEKVYGDGSMWTVLHRANGSMVLPNGNPLVLAETTITVPR